VIRDHPDYPGELARFVTAPTPYALVSDTVAGLHAQLPIGLVRSEHQLSDPPEVVEVWLHPA
jgi:hypothetical protein